MKKPIRPIRKMLDNAQRRFVRSRSGSVLILVVALLVLMALIGTAYMTMAQFDRVAAAQHTFNTEVDLLLDGVINQVKATVTGDLFLNGQFRPGTPAYSPGTPTPGWSPYSSLGLDSGTAGGLAASNPNIADNPGTWWIASRVPDFSPNLLSVNASAGSPWWGFVTGPINQGGLFDTPYWPNNTSIRYSFRTGLNPGAVTVNGQLYPAWSNVGNIMAANASGDGIADSGYVKLLTLDGVTYYAAIRILDNCSAVNATIATRPNWATMLNGSSPTYSSMPGDFSPANLDLEGMLIDPRNELYSTQVNNKQPAGLLGYRYNVNAGGSGINLPLFAGIDEKSTGTRSDFYYMLYPGTGLSAGMQSLAFDQQWMQLGRRMDNPGNIAVGTAPTSKYQTLTSIDAIALARNFILCDPKVAASGVSSSPLEQCLFRTLVGSASNTAYQPSNVVNWFNANFNYSATNNNNGAIPMRALVVERSQVSNFVASKFRNRTYPATDGLGPYNFGDMVAFPNTGGQQYVCINPNTTSRPITPIEDPLFGDPNWAYEPWTTAPTKTSVNTATFQQLYVAYWEVMADQYNNNTTNPKIWAPGWDASNSVAGKMFRTPVRASTKAPAQVPLLPQQVMYLRAAIAAVNTMDLRDSDDDVTSRTIAIPSTVQGQTPTVQATIYGMEKQPYFVQMIARNDPKDPKSDWLGIEVYNPFPTAIQMNNWQWVAFDRNGQTLTSIAKIPNTTIPKNSSVVFYDNNIGATPPNANVKPLPKLPNPPVGIANFANQAFGKELVLMRPRRADGTITTSARANNFYNENNVADLVPVDSYDFTNLPATADVATGTEWDYGRPSAPNLSWHCVYPGPWNQGAMADQPTVAGTVFGPAPMQTDPTMLGTPLAAPLKSFNPTGGNAPLMNYQDVPLQVANVNFGGPMKLPTNAPAYFPFGAFARNGDLLQVTFIGSYRLSAYTPGATATTPTKILELNPVTMDSAMATADNVTFQPIVGSKAPYAENIGRFCPMDPNDGGASSNDYIATSNATWKYRWAMKLFDYLTVQSPQDDYTPQYNPWHAEPTSPNSSSGFVYTPANANRLLAPEPVANVTSGIANSLNTTNPPAYNTNNATEETAPINGLININTAPWRVLATVPWVPATDGAYQTKNAAIAQAIVQYRDINDGSGVIPAHGHGPFRNIFELMEVPTTPGTPATGPTAPLLRNVDGNTSVTTPGPATSLPLGDIVWAGQPNTATGVQGDFETMFLTLTRVSNLITTHSDSYTAYILVQGWRNAETNNPTLVVQRRAAIIIDRSSVTPTNTSPTVTNVPPN